MCTVDGDVCKKVCRWNKKIPQQGRTLSSIFSLNQRPLGKGKWYKYLTKNWTPIAPPVESMFEHRSLGCNEAPEIGRTLHNYELSVNHAHLPSSSPSLWTVKWAPEYCLLAGKCDLRPPASAIEGLDKWVNISKKKTTHEGFECQDASHIADIAMKSTFQREIKRERGRGCLWR